MVHDIDVTLFQFFYDLKTTDWHQKVIHSVNSQQNGTNIMHHSVFELTEWHPFCLSLQMCFSNSLFFILTSFWSASDVIIPSNCDILTSSSGQISLRFSVTNSIRFLVIPEAVLPSFTCFHDSY